MKNMLSMFPLDHSCIIYAIIQHCEVERSLKFNAEHFRVGKKSSILGSCIRKSSREVAQEAIIRWNAVNVNTSGTECAHLTFPLHIDQY
uniref:Uncharacterized protein n=1 Tax=Parascaris equorum TaxID=6256 RepID=A0A914RHJ6_PAREQ